MSQTVVGMFDRYEEARRAADLLRARGVPDADVQVTASDDSAEYRHDTTRAERDEDQGLMARIRSFFAEVFGSGDDRDDDVHAYAEHVRRGGAVVKVSVDDESRLDAVRETLDDAGAVDIDERVEQWRAGGWRAGDVGASAVSGTEGERTTVSPGNTHPPAGDRPAVASDSADTERRDEQLIPVLREEVQVGKRAVGRGSVRVYSHVRERPVEEQVRLREEHARIERHPVDRPLAEGDAQAFRERSVEVRESAEEPVVSKRAHVVEEVVVGKEVRERTETVRDKVRETEVDVRQEGRADSRGEIGGREPRSGLLDTSSYDDPDFGPAYEYGHRLAADDRYAGRDWDSFEDDARADWERDHPDQPWERMKDAARHAWQRVRH